MTAGASAFRLAAVGDVHVRENDAARMKELVRAVNAEADALVLCGDLTDRGTAVEAKVLADALAGLTVPCAAVLGNHDHDAGLAAQIVIALHDVGVPVLDGDHVVFRDEIGVAGVKGFGGGFGHGTLQAFGEASTKAFVQEAVNEALKLESALGQLDTPKRVVIMHYAPIVATTEGEDCEIRAYLGSSRLAAPLDLYGADVVFHGHAHHGAPEGETAKGIPVRNVALPVVKKALGRAFLLFELR